ncbi:helix-turn-helix transcriptional regulator, partial [Streptomyces sp. NPDC057654]|uniref:helix-turn-helix transcriptional regulator n=1 Tax=Streptomyces sp. NPDC057654 TaxID=3346196 RepID=UPI0036AED057
MSRVLPLANGLRTDHPVPGLPFIDDSHLPLDEGPEAIEAVGRNQGEGMWGRFDQNRSDKSWRAFTTDPLDHTLGWAVRYRPEHGRTVLLVRDDDTSFLHTEWGDEQLLFRAGGYWWNGTTWYRPSQVWDPVTQDYERRKARMAVTVTAADLLDGRTNPAKAYIGEVTAFDPDAARPGNWPDHLALWAQQHQEQDGALPLERCVVDVSSPELTGAQLIGAPELAELGGITSSTLRAYISRGNSEVPRPQAVVGGRDQWARAVADDWVEARKRSYTGVGEAMSAGDRDALSPGAAEVRDRFAADFQHALYDRPDVRKRWVLRHRSRESVAQIAGELAWSVAAGLDQIVPTEYLGFTVRAAVLHDFAEAINLCADGKDGEASPKWWHFNLTPQVGKMLDWYVRCFPGAAYATIGDIQERAHTLWEASAADTLKALRSALSLDGKLTEHQRETYFALLEPHKDT